MVSNQPYNEHELLLAVADGDEAAFRQLYDRYWNQVFSFAMNYLKMSGWAEDMLQEVFAKIWQKRDSLREVRSFADFLFIVTRNEVITALRQKARKEEVYQQYIKDHEQKAVLNVQHFTTDIEKIVTACLSQLNPQQQLIFKLSRENGLTLDEIATQLGVSKKTVSNTLSIILAELRLAFNRHGIVLSSWIMLTLIFPVI